MRGVVFLIGLGLVLVALLMGLLGAHAARLRTWDRPRFTLTPHYASLWKPARRLLLAGGLLCLAWSSLLAVVVACVVLGALWAWLRWVRSPRYRLHQLERQVAALAARSPESARRDLLCQVLLRSHPEWGQEVVQQIVDENPSVADVARMVVRMEKGWPG